MVNILLWGAIVRPRPSCTNLIIYPVIITLFLYSDISSVQCANTYAVFTLSPNLLSSSFSLSHSLPFSSLHLIPSLPPSLPPFLLHRSSPFTIDVYLLYAYMKLAKLGKVPTFGKYCFSNCQIHSLHVVFL